MKMYEMWRKRQSKANHFKLIIIPLIKSNKYPQVRFLSMKTMKRAHYCMLFCAINYETSIIFHEWIVHLISGFINCCCLPYSCRFSSDFETVGKTEWQTKPSIEYSVFAHEIFFAFLNVYPFHEWYENKRYVISCGTLWSAQCWMVDSYWTSNQMKMKLFTSSLFQKSCRN